MKDGGNKAQARKLCSVNDQTLWTLYKRMRWPEHYGNIVRRGEILSRHLCNKIAKMVTKVTELITNDLWIQNLRSTGI
jgi:hypothetical protein